MLLVEFHVTSGYTTVFDVNSAGTLQKGLRSGSASVIHRLKLACGHLMLQSFFVIVEYIFLLGPDLRTIS